MIQTVKCSPLVDIKFNPGFYDVLCSLNLFFCKQKFFVSLASACHLRDVYFLQSVPKFHSNSKMLFLKPYNCLSKFLGALLKFSNFLLQGKILCFARISMSLARCLFPKRSEDLVQKIIPPVIFDTNCSFKL